MGGSSSDGSSSSSGFLNSLFNMGQYIPNWQRDALTNLYGSTSRLNNWSTQGLQQWTPTLIGQLGGIANSADNYWRYLLGGGALSGMNQSHLNNYLYNDAQAIKARDLRNTINAGNSSLDNLLSQNLDSMAPRIYAQVMGGEGNTYADAMKDQYVKDANRSYENMMSNLDARAEAAGMSGASRHGVAQGIGARGINDALQANLAKVGYETFDKDLMNKMNIAQMADSNQFGLQQAKINALSGNIANNVNAIAPGAMQQSALGMNAIMQALGMRDSSISQAVGMAPQQQSLRIGQMSPYMLPWQNQSIYGSIIRDPNVLSKINSSTNSQWSGSGNTSSKGGGIK